MPIRKRTFSPVVETVTEETVNVPAVEPEISDELSSEEVEAHRLIMFVQGNEGSQPHPRDEPTAKMLALVQTVQNVNDPFGRQEAFYRNRIRSPLTGIRAFCVMCMGGAKAASACTSTQCPLWSFKNGKNAFFGKIKANPEGDEA